MLVATLVIHGGTATVTLTDYVEHHHNVTIRGFFSARIDASTAPGGTDNLTWNVNGKTSTTPVVMSQCPHCTQLPTKAKKSGTVIDGTIDIALNVAVSTTADQAYTFTDTLTSPGQEFRCPVTAKASIYPSRTAWGAPIYTGHVPVSVSACGTGAITGTITIHAVGTAARIILPVAITDPSLTSWTDSASVTSNGVTQGTSARVESFAGGGSGDGNKPHAVLVGLAVGHLAGTRWRDVRRGGRERVLA